MKALIVSILIFGYLSVTQPMDELLYKYNTNIPDLNVIKQLKKPIGKDIRLSCQIAGASKNMKIQWKFKRCGDYFQSNCKHTIDWALVMDDDYIIIGRENNETISKRVFCNEPCITLNIMNLQMNDSGLYRCFALHEDTDTIQKMKVYELVPIDFDQNPPQIIGSPPNKMTIYTDEKAVLQCKFRSKHLTTIWWLKYSIKSDDNTLANDEFEVCNSTEAVLINKNTYISKFVVPHATLLDKGLYECLAINYFGYTHKSTYLNVVNKSIPIFGYDSAQYLLFLIPLYFLFISLCIWICSSYPNSYYVKNSL